MFPTATPNRPDDLPLGIDEVAHAVTYRELVERGAELRPRFEPFPVPDFCWESPALARLAAEVVRRADDDFTKVLEVAPTVEKVRAFSAAVRTALADAPALGAGACQLVSVFEAGKHDSPCHQNHFWSLHSGGANFAFADESVRFLRYSAASVLPALATKAGGETVAVPD